MMKKVSNCKDENCIPTPSSCVTWNGGEIDFLGICDGESLNLLTWEIISKLQEIAGEDLSQFDIDSLADICNKKAPTEITILSILNLLKDTQICLKDFLDGLSETLSEILDQSSVNVNLKCYAQFDNIGNSLAITRDELDQLVIDNLCNHKERIESLEGKVITLQSQIDNLSTSSTVDELNFDTCLDPGVDKPTSSNVVEVAQAHCDLEEATGAPADIASATANFPTGSVPTSVTLNPNWIAAPANQAEVLSNNYLVQEYLLNTMANILANCCAIDCTKVKIGYTVAYNEDGDGVLVTFTSGAGFNVPADFEDLGSTITVTDKNGDIETYTTAAGEIALNEEIEIPVNSLDLSGDLTISVKSVFSNGSITCQDCSNKNLKNTARCSFCTITNAGADGDIIIIYDDQYNLLVQTISTTTTSTTTVGI